MLNYQKRSPFITQLPITVEDRASNNFGPDHHRITNVRHISATFEATISPLRFGARTIVVKISPRDRQDRPTSCQVLSAVAFELTRGL